MSYILNALKKAERDRMREEPQDLDDFVGADWDPYQVEKSGSRGYKRLPLLLSPPQYCFSPFTA